MTKPERVAWPHSVENRVLTQSHHRCCICPEHRRVANIHHINGNPSNSVEDNAVGLCAECHADVHTSSTMRRNITPDQVKQYKRAWVEKCSALGAFLRSNVNEFRGVYYMNVHRVDELYRTTVGQSFLSSCPHDYPTQDGRYNTLWANPKNSLDWKRLAENRSFLNERLEELVPKLGLHDLNLMEVGAIAPDDLIGQLVGFSCQFFGRDIPEPDELVESQGAIIGPPPTMRREIRDEVNEFIMETCLVLDMDYMYADSSFIHFAEQGVWSGFGRLMKVREGIGSNDGPLLRKQMVIAPICICTPTDHSRTSRVAADACNADKQYRNMVNLV